MKSNYERKFMSAAIRNASASLLGLGVVVGLGTVRAASDDSIPNALRALQANGVSSTPSAEETYLPEANILIDVIVRPLFSCCPPLPPATPRFTCDDTQRMTKVQCRAAGGSPVRSCEMCLSVDRVAGNPDEEVDATQDDSLVPESADAAPIDPVSGSAWNLFVVTFFLASL